MNLKKLLTKHEETLLVKAQNSIDEMIVDLSAKWIVNSSKKDYSEDEIIDIKENLNYLMLIVSHGGKRKF